MRKLFLIVLVLFFFNSFAQQRYWIVLDDTKCTNCVVGFQEWLKSECISVHIASEWLGSLSAELDVAQIGLVGKHDWVKELREVRTFEFVGLGEGITKESLDEVLKQINGQFLVENELTGKGVKIGVIDAGFVNSDSNELFKHLAERGSIRAVKDFVDTNRDDFYTKKTAGCTHGREVLKRITGWDQNKKLFYGLATESHFYLARTENGDKEQRVEEDNWVAAIEWLHKQGVRLINTSLGYGNDFDDPQENYIPQQMDGNTALITKAAQIAVRDKGMIIVSSAGNNGNKDWRIVTAPGDCKEVITVGATNKESFSKIGYSSIGADFVNFVKPDVSCYSPSGTSYSAPVITGVIACMLQQDSTLTNDEIKDYLFQSSHLYPVPNNFLGYGVPDMQKLLKLVKKDTLQTVFRTIRANAQPEIAVAIPLETEKVIVFHKKDKWKVVSQEIHKITHSKSGRAEEDESVFFKKDGQLFMRVVHDSKHLFSTIDTGSELIEIEW